jgi:hypothetical protein
MKEGREIIAEHQEIDATVCSSAFALQGSPLGAQSVVFFPRPVRHAD